MADFPTTNQFPQTVAARPAGGHERRRTAGAPCLRRRRRHRRLDDGADPGPLAARARRARSRCSSRRAVGIIGVGEGSTPWLRGFFDSLGIEEAEWMPACHATYKCGITFDGLVHQAGLRELLPPVRLDARQPDDDASSCTTSRRASNGADVHAHPEPLFHRRARSPRTAMAPKPQRRLSRSTSGTAITSMPCCSASSCSSKARRARRAATRAATSRTCTLERATATSRRSARTEGETIAARLLRRLHRLRRPADRARRWARRS